VLTDEQATATNLRAALKKLAAARPSDTVLIFLSGHGVRSGGRFYFAPHGVEVGNVAGTCLAWSEVVGSLSNLYARKLLFADACHSGTRLGSWQATSGQLSAATDARAGILLLASSSGDEYSYEDAESRHGTFTVALLEAINGTADLNKNGTVTLPEFINYVGERVSELGKNLQNPHVVGMDFSLRSPLARVAASTPP